MDDWDEARAPWIASAGARSGQQGSAGVQGQRRGRAHAAPTASRMKDADRCGARRRLGRGVDALGLPLSAAAQPPPPGAADTMSTREQAITRNLAARPRARRRSRTGPGIGRSRITTRAEQLLAAAIERQPKSRELLLADRACLHARSQAAQRGHRAQEGRGARRRSTQHSRFQLALAYIAHETRRLGASRARAPGPVRSPPNTSYLVLARPPRLRCQASTPSAIRAPAGGDPRATGVYPRATTTSGLCYEALNQTDDAIPHYREAIRLNRIDARANRGPGRSLNLGMLLRKRGELEEAEKLVPRGVDRSSRHFAPALLPARYGTRGTRIGLDEAVTMLERAASADPAYAEPHFALARIYRRQGRATDADAALATFERLHAPTREPRP